MTQEQGSPIPQRDRFSTPPLRLSGIVPDLVRRCPVVADLDMGNVLTIVTDSVGQPRTEVTHAAALFLRHLHAAQAAGGHVRPRQDAQTAGDARSRQEGGLLDAATVVEMLPLILEAGGRSLQRAWLEDPHHPRWGVAVGVHPTQIRQCVGRLMPPDSDLTLLAGRLIGMGAALQCHRAGVGPTANDLAQSLPLRAAVATMLELLAPSGASPMALAEEASRLSDAGMTQGGRTLRETASELVRAWAMLQKAAVSEGLPPRDIAARTAEEPGFSTVAGLSPMFLHEALATLPVVPPALRDRARAVLDAVSVSPAESQLASPQSTTRSAPRPAPWSAVETSAAVKLLEVIAGRPQLLDLGDGICWARWLRGLMDIPQAQHQTWRLLMREVVLSAERGMGPTWAPTIAALRAAQPFDGGGTPIWTESILLTWSRERSGKEPAAGGSISQDMYGVFEHLIQGAPEVVGERLRLIWSQPGWPEALRRWLTARRLLTVAPAVWRPFLQDPDAETRMFAVQMMGRYHDSQVARAATGAGADRAASAATVASPTATDADRDAAAAPALSPALTSQREAPASPGMAQTAEPQEILAPPRPAPRRR